MKVKLFMLFGAATLAILAGATPAVAGQFSFGFSFGYPGYPAYGYFGYNSGPPVYAYGAYGPPVVYPVPAVRPYYYAPYRYRVVPAYRPYCVKPYRKGGRYSAYVPRRYHRH
jgi:hypothetical protein